VSSQSQAAFVIELAGRTWRAGDKRHDLSIPLVFDGEQPNFFGVAPAAGLPIHAGSFIGAVTQGGSCNCSTYSLTPHCNGTHTECVGHLTAEPLSVRDLLVDSFAFALLISASPRLRSQTRESTEPQPREGDSLITREALETASEQFGRWHDALIVRSLPNDTTKLMRQYGSGEGIPYFSAEAMRWIVARGVRHLIVDLPSVDRGNDDGRLTAHRIFWNVPTGTTRMTDTTRAHCTITELAFIDDSIRDGEYLLNLQIAPFMADAAPSRPILLSLEPL
jgi:kynurenine formamidase